MKSERMSDDNDDDWIGPTVTKRDDINNGQRGCFVLSVDPIDSIDLISGLLGSLGALLGPLGALLGNLLGVFGRPDKNTFLIGRPKCPLRALLRPSWDPLESLGSFLGPFRGPLRTLLGRSGASWNPLVEPWGLLVPSCGL